jgi:anti-anti-sigma factor
MPRRHRSAGCEGATARPRAARGAVRRCPSGARRDLTARVTRRDGAHARVEIVGEIDVHTSGELRTILLALADEGHVHLVADFAGVRFCDAAGLGVLVGVNNRLGRDGGSLRLTGVRPAQRRILTITRLDRLFRPHDDAGEAVPT